MNLSLISSEVDKCTAKNENEDTIVEENFCQAKENMENIAEMENKLENQKKKVEFWGENPNILFKYKYLSELFPVDTMTYNQKLNAITRTTLILVLFTFFYAGSLRILIIGLITLLAIYTLHYYHVKEKEKFVSKRLDADNKENFSNPVMDYLKEGNVEVSDDVFDKPDSSNPFGNVLVTDHDYNPNKKPAPPAYNKKVNDDILSEAKKLVNDANPDHPDIADKLFSDMASNLQLEQSLRPFHSTANTTIPNDQTAFAEFCYGSMVSCKEGNDFACARNLARHTNY
jgi:hypothetical protein